MGLLPSAGGISIKFLIAKHLLSPFSLTHRHVYIEVKNLGKSEYRKRKEAEVGPKHMEPGGLSHPPGSRTASVPWLVAGTPSERPDSEAGVAARKRTA
jgi:hypothetical protein